MGVALYHPELGYYTTAARRSGRAGDFYTSVDAGPLFGELLARLFVRLWATITATDSSGQAFDLVEAGAGDGRLTRDVLDALERLAPSLYASTRVHLLETSALARRCHVETLGPHAPRLVTSSATLPERVSGIVLANELLDAMPAHRVVGVEGGLREIFVDVEDNRFMTREGPLSTPRLASYLEQVDARLDPGQVADISLSAVDWVGEIGHTLEQGLVLLIDYGDGARALFSARHPEGTLRGFYRHLVDAPFDGVTPGAPRWLERPGEQDLTASVDFTAIERAAEAAGLVRVGLVDQAHLLVAAGLDEALADAGGHSLAAVRSRLAAQTLVAQGGPGTTHKALLLAKRLAPSAIGALADALRPI